jgi:hypothetical protein
MPQGGNFGGASIPDTVIGLDLLYVGRTTTYKDYTCTKIVATADTATWTYSSPTGVAVSFDLTSAGDSLDFMLDPKQMTTKGNGKAVALCYSCDCNEPMTGTTAFDQTGYGGSLTGGTATWATNNGSPFAPVIIGGGGLNN